MKISVITATYNSVSSIADTQRTIAEQDYPRDLIEWIVVDGASTDGSVESVRQQSRQPDQLVSEPDRGIYDALNKGIRMSTGDVIGFLHADDFFASPTVLSRIADTFNRTQAAAVYGDLQYVCKLDAGDYGLVRNWVSGRYSPQKLKWGWMPPHPALYLKREIYDQAKMDSGEYFDTAFSCAADYDFILRILSKPSLQPEYINEVLVKMRTGGLSNRSLAHIIRKSKEDWLAIRRNRAGHLHTLLWKNISKLHQFIMKP